MGRTKKLKFSNLLKFIFSGIVLLGFYVLFSLGWITSPVPWERATGWDHIPESAQARFYQHSSYEPKIYWLGHAGFFIQWAGQNILIDPVLSDRVLFVRRHMKIDFNLRDLPDIDAVLLSHAHYDHLDNSTIDGIKSLKNIILPPGTEDFLSDRTRKERNIVSLNYDETFELGPVQITAVKAMHKGGRSHPFPGKYLAAGYIIKLRGVALYVSGDTAYGPHFKDIKDRYRPSLAILPIGGYAPRIPLKYHHLSPADAVLAAKELGVSKMIPGHFGTFRISFDNPATALPLFSKLTKAQNLYWEMPRLLTKENCEGVSK